MKNIISKSPFLLTTTLILFGFSCGDSEPTREIRYKLRQSDDVDKAFLLASRYATGTVAGAEIKGKIDALSAADLEKLANKRHAMSDFLVLMALGTASNEQREVLIKVFDTAADNRTAAETQVICKKLFRALREGTRPENEPLEALNKNIAMVIQRCNDQINNLKKPDESIDVATFNGVVPLLAPKTNEVVAKIDESYLNSWLSWAIDPANKATAQPLFKLLYEQLEPSEKARLRNLLVAQSYDADATKRQANMNSLLEEAANWGINLNTDMFVLTTPQKGTEFNGSLLYVLAKRAVRENLSTSSRQPFVELRGYAQKFKAALNDDAQYQEHVKTMEFGSSPPEKINDVLTKTLRHKNYEDFVNFYLALETPKDVLVATARPVAEVSNQMVRELYESIINSDAKAAELASETADDGSGRFIQKLLSRPIDENSFAVVTPFLASAYNLNGQAGVTQVLSDSTGGKNAIKIVLDLNRQPEDELFKDKIVGQLIEHEDGSAISSLSNNEIENRADLAFAKRGANESGKADFKALYAKLAPDPNQQKVLRSKLLTNALADGLQATQELVDNIADVSDGWGLRAGLETDEYSLSNAGAPISGTLLFALTKHAKVNTLEALRNQAKALKPAVANFTNFIASSKIALEQTLTVSNKQNFVNYYLANETPNDVFEAVQRPEVTTIMVKDLYDLIIGSDDNQAVILAAAVDGTNQGFVHHLFARGTDESTAYLANKFFNSIQKVQGNIGEVNQLGAVGGLKLPLQILLDGNRAVQDDIAQKTAMFRRVSRNATVAHFAGLTPQDLYSQIKVFSESQALFKRVYLLFDVASPEAQALRSALLAQSYDEGPVATKTLIAEITDAQDLWGLGTAITRADGFIIERNPSALGNVTGSLLYVLAQRAIDDKQEGVVRAFNHLRDFAMLIRNKVDPGYTAHINDATSGTSILALVQNALTPTNQQSFTNTYLAAEDPTEIFDAAGDVAITNARLKDLYILIIGNDDAKAFQLSQANAAGERFIHRLVRRAVDDDGSSSVILEKFLTSLFNHNAANAGGELAQLNDNGGGLYPIQILASAGRVGDNPVHKATMLLRLLDHDDSTASGSLSAADLADQKFYRGGSDGKKAFKSLYSKINQDPVKAKSMRNGLLLDAYSVGWEAVAKLAEGIGSANDDPWGLFGGLSAQAPNVPDDYDLAHSPGVGGILTGTLLYVLTEKAIEDSVAAPLDKRYDSFKRLRDGAIKIRQGLETTGAGNYVKYADHNAPQSAITSLKNHLGGNKPGHAEYYLVLDRSYAPFNDDLLMAAANPPAGKIDYNILQWLYENIVLSDPEATTLAAKNIAGDKFLHLVLSKGDLNSKAKEIIDNYFQRLANGGPGSVAAEIDAVNAAGQTALKILLSPRNDKGAKEYKEIVPLVARESLTAIGALNDPTEIKDLLKAVRAGGQAAPTNDLEKVFVEISDAQIGALALWCGASVAEEALGKFSNADIATFFRAEYAKRVAMQTEMRNKVIRGAFDYGKNKSEPKGAFDAVAEVINLKFFDFATLQNNNFNPFELAHDATLLYSVISNYPIADLRHSVPTYKLHIESLIAALKAAFIEDDAVNGVANWQNYLQNPLSQTAAGPKSVINLLLGSGVGGLDAAKVKEWLEF